MAATWKTRDGCVLIISEMSTEHIVNTINMIRRNTWRGHHVSETRLEQLLMLHHAKYRALVAEYNRRVARALANLLDAFRDGTIVRAMAMELN